MILPNVLNFNFMSLQWNYLQASPISWDYPFKEDLFYQPETHQQSTWCVFANTVYCSLSFIRKKMADMALGLSVQINQIIFTYQFKQ
jgi:hypothetical protein